MNLYLYALHALWVSVCVQWCLHTYIFKTPYSTSTCNISTVDGRNPKQPPAMWKNPANSGINYQPQLVNAGFPSTLYPWRLAMEVWKIIFLSKWVICRFQPFIFQGVSQGVWRPLLSSFNGLCFWNWLGGALPIRPWLGQKTRRPYEWHVSTTRQPES